MNCHEVRRALALQFDQGMPPRLDASEHLSRCSACARYQQRLEAVETALATLPQSNAPVDLADRIKAQLRTEVPVEPVQPRLLLPWLALATLVAAIAGWFYPVAVNYRGWWRNAENAVAAFDSRQLIAPWLERARDALRLAESWLEGAPDVPHLYLWFAVGGGLLILIAFNGMEARSLRRR